MADAASPATFDIEEQRAHRACAGGDPQIRHRAAQADRGAIQAGCAEQAKLTAEQFKMTAEAAKLGRDRALAPWQVALSGMAAGAASFGAAFVKLLGA